MTADGPNYSRNIVRRQQVVMVVCVFSFMVTFATVGVGMAKLIGHRTDFEPGVPGLLIVGTAVLSGFLTAALAGVFSSRIHRSLWPEHPDDAHER